MKKLYLLKSFDKYGEEVYKIGFTRQKVEKRVKQLKTGNSNPIDIIYIYEPDNYCVSIETLLHKHFESKRTDGEWFKLSNEDISNFPKLCEDKYKIFKSLEGNSWIEERKINLK